MPTRAAPPRSIRDTITSAKGGEMSVERGTQTVLITGATDGLGKAATLLLAERGYRVFAAARSSEKRAQPDALAKEKKLPPQTLHTYVLDATSVQMPSA